MQPTPARGLARRGDAAQAEYLLVCGAIAGPLFVVTFAIAGATRADYAAPSRCPSPAARGYARRHQSTNRLMLSST